MVTFVVLNLYIFFEYKFWLRQKKYHKHTKLKHNKSTYAHTHAECVINVHFCFLLTVQFNKFYMQKSYFFFASVALKHIYWNTCEYNYMGCSAVHFLKCCWINTWHTHAPTDRRIPAAVDLVSSTVHGSSWLRILIYVYITNIFITIQKWY